VFNGGICIQEFFEYLKKSEFMLPVCTKCNCSAWPPSSYCPQCRSKISLKKIDTTGTLLEFSRSHVRGKEGVFGLVEISGIRLVGSFGDYELKVGMKVKMTSCGLQSDGTAFYLFAPVDS
jgi:uncharacterized OB-fold protein